VHGWVDPQGNPATGKVTLQPVMEAPGGGYIVVNQPVTFTLSAGNISGTIASNAQATTLQYLVREDIQDAESPSPYVVTPSGSTLDLSTASRGTLSTSTALYVLASTVGQPGGVASLDSSGLIPQAEIPNPIRPWNVAEQYAGLWDPTVLVDYPDNNPNTGITLDSGVYENYNFVCSELIIPNNDTYLFNCAINTYNDTFGVRLDANSGFEVGRRLAWCTITSASVAFSGAGFAARFCRVVHNGDDSARVGRSYAEPTVFELCHFSDFEPAAGAHADGVQILSYPGADVVVWGCSISMNTATGYTLPPDTGYTGAIFYDPTDVPIGPSDPEPNRIGAVRIAQSKLVSSQNYTLVIDQPGVDVSDCMLLPGTTAILSNPNSSAITGHNNVDVGDRPIGDLDILGYLAEPITIGQAQDVDLLTIAPSNGSVLTYSSTSRKWVPGAGVTGGIKIRQEWITSGSFTCPNNGGSIWSILRLADNATVAEIDMPAVVGQWVEISISATRTPSDAIDVGVVVGSTIVRYLATGTGSPAHDGDMGWYTGSGAGSSFFSRGGVRGFTTTSGDLDGGNVRFCLISSGSGTSQILATVGDPYYWQVTNLGVVS